MRVRAISDEDGHEIGTEWDEECTDAARLWIERGIIEEVKPATPAVSFSQRQDKAVHAESPRVKRKSVAAPSPITAE